MIIPEDKARHFKRDINAGAGADPDRASKDVGLLVVQDKAIEAEK